MNTLDNIQTVHSGTELKLHITIEPIGDYKMVDYNFLIDIYCNSGKKVISLSKEKDTDKIKLVDDDTYMVLVNTSNLDTGELKCKVTAYIPDGDFIDRTRTEVAIIPTNIRIIK